MFEVVAQMGAIILLGVVWRVVKPGGLDPQVVRKALTDTVYYLFLPALVLSILWRTELNLDSFRIVILAVTGVLAGFFIGITYLQQLRVLHYWRQHFLMPPI